VRAIILAAGEGKRLRPYTADRPKSMVELAGKPLLVHQIEALRTCGVDDFTIVTGYRADQIESLGHPTVRNAEFDRTNMVASLMCARERLDGGDDVLVAYADILYEARIVRELMACPDPLSTAINLDWRRLWELRMEDPLADAETLKCDDDGNIVELGRKPGSLADVEGQYMGLIRIAKETCRELVEFHDNLDSDGEYDGKDLANMYMTSFLQALIDAGRKLRAVFVHGGWLELDSTDDLHHYRDMLAAGTLAEIWNPGNLT
jgi:choline kinase